MAASATSSDHPLLAMETRERKKSAFRALMLLTSIFSVALWFWLARRMNWYAAVGVVSKVELGWLIAVVPATLVSAMLSGYQYIQAVGIWGGRLSLGQAVWYTLWVTCLGAASPGRALELLALPTLRSQAGISNTECLLTWAVLRAGDVIAALLCLVLSWHAIPVRPLAVGMLVELLTGTAVVLFLTPFPFNGRDPDTIVLLPQQAKNALRGVLAMSPTYRMRLLGGALVIRLSMWIGAVLIAHAFGYHSNAGSVGLLIMSGSIAGSVMPTPAAGTGYREMISAWALGYYHVPTTSAVLMSEAYFLFGALLPGLVGAAYGGIQCFRQQKQ